VTWKILIVLGPDNERQTSEKETYDEGRYCPQSTEEAVPYGPAKKV